jgi:hypothetical protein
VVSPSSSPSPRTSRPFDSDQRLASLPSTPPHPSPPYALVDFGSFYSHPMFTSKDTHPGRPQFLRPCLCPPTLKHFLFASARPCRLDYFRTP